MPRARSPLCSSAESADGSYACRSIGAGGPGERGVLRPPRAGGSVVPARCASVSSVRRLDHLQRDRGVRGGYGSGVITCVLPCMHAAAVLSSHSLSVNDGGMQASPGSQASPRRGALRAFHTSRFTASRGAREVLRARARTISSGNLTNFAGAAPTLARSGSRCGRARDPRSSQ